jgi:hypothetical protein
MMASAKGHFHVVEFLISVGADIQQADEVNRSPSCNWLP